MRLSAALAAPGVSARRSYVDGPFGQMHVWRAEPSDPAAARRRTLLFLHQNPSSSFEAAPLMREMAKDRTVLGFDAPSYGMSDGPDRPLEIEEYVRAFVAGLETLGTGPVDVFGFHSGTVMAAELALQRPDLVHRIVLSGIPFFPEEQRLKRLEEARNSAPLDDDGTVVFERMRYMWDYTVKQRAPGVEMRRAAEVFLDKSRMLDRYWWMYAGIWNYDQAERLPRLDRPTLTLVPEEMLAEPSRQATKLIPNAKLVELPDITRDMYDTGTARYAEEMRRFLDG